MSTRTKAMKTTVLCDLENVHYSLQNQPGRHQQFGPLTPFHELQAWLREQTGKAPEGLVVADWTRMSMYSSVLTKLGWTPIQYSAEGFRNGKNGGDIALTVETMRRALKLRTPQRFVIMSGDIDFMPLLAFLKQKGHEVWVLGVSTSTSGALAQMADRFESIDAHMAPAPVVTGDLSSLGQGPVSSVADRTSLHGHVRRLGFYLARGSAGLAGLVLDVAREQARFSAAAWEQSFQFILCAAAQPPGLFVRPCRQPKLLVTSMMKLLRTTEVLQEDPAGPVGETHLKLQPGIQTMDQLVSYLRTRLGPMFLESMALGPKADLVLPVQGWKAWPFSAVNPATNTVDQARLTLHAAEPAAEDKRGWVLVKNHPKIWRKPGAPLPSRFDTLGEAGVEVGWNMTELTQQLLARDHERSTEGV